MLRFLKRLFSKKYIDREKNKCVDGDYLFCITDGHIYKLTEGTETFYGVNEDDGSFISVYPESNFILISYEEWML